MFIWVTEDKKDLLVVSEYDKEYDFLSKFILYEVFVAGTVDEIHFLVISENKVVLFTMSYIELQLNLLILLLETVKFWGIDLLTDFKIEIESELEDFGNKGLLRAVQF